MTVAAPKKPWTKPVVVSSAVEGGPAILLGFSCGPCSGYQCAQDLGYCCCQPSSADCWTNC